MAFVRSERLWETSTTTGTGTLTLAGAVTGYRAFSAACANGDTVWYTVVNQAATSEWESGIGTWNTGGTLSRTTILESSNSGAAVNFSAGTKDVFCQLPAKHVQGGGAAEGYDALKPVITVRQTARLGAVDSSGYANFISAGAGLNFNVDASPTPLVIDFAAGVVDYSATVSADASNQGSLAASNTNFVYATYATPTTVTWSNCLVPPQYGYAFDRAQNALLNFEGADTSTTILDDFGNTWTASGNAQLDTAQKKFGSSSLLLDGTGDYISSTDFKTFGDGSWEMSCWARFNALPTSGNRMEFFHMSNAGGFGARLLLFNNAGTTKLETFLSSNGTSADIANGTVGTTTSWSTATWYKVRLVFDALAGNYKVYLSNAGAAESSEITVSSSAKICACSVMRLSTDPTTTVNYLNGWIDGFRFIRAATVTGTETPSASAPTVADYPVHWFSIPEMKMYEVTSASGSAGTNPGMTARNRVFVGEADTNGSTVTAARTYALRGQYDSGAFTVSAPNTYTKTHNVGVLAEWLIPRMFWRQDATKNWKVAQPYMRDGAPNNIGWIGNRATARNSFIVNYPSGNTMYNEADIAFNGGEARLQISRAF